MSVNERMVRMACEHGLPLAIGASTTLYGGLSDPLAWAYLGGMLALMWARDWAVRNEVI